VISNQNHLLSDLKSWKSLD